jgi:hypothetical protein
MRILFFCHYFPPEGNAPASRTHENCKRWVAAGHDVTVVTCAPNCPDGVVFDGYKNKLYQREVVDGIDVRRVWTYIAANEGTVRRIANYVSYMLSAFIVSFFLKRPDVVIATSPQFFCGWAGVLYRWYRRVPFILEIRDIWPESIVAVGAMRESKMIRFLEYLELKMYAAADHIVTVGDGYRRQLEAKDVVTDNISVIMNGVNRELFQPRTPDESIKEQWGVGGKFICSYSGTIGMACALGVVLDAAESLKERGVDDIAFLLVGDGAARKDLETEAKARGLENVVFTGRQPKDTMPDYLALTDVCLVHLRKTDLFTSVMPSKIFEAAGMAKPILNGVGGFAADFIDKAGAGINIEPENSEQLVEHLLALRADEAQRQALGESGQRYVVANFDRDKLAEEYLDILDSVSHPEEAHA